MRSPTLVPERDLKGATPEKLARALLRPIYRRRRDGASVARERAEESGQAGEDQTDAGVGTRSDTDTQPLRDKS